MTLLSLLSLGGKDQRKSGVSQGSGYSDEGLSVQETAAVFANFEFLANQEMDMDEIDDLEAKQMHHTAVKQGIDVLLFKSNSIWSHKAYNFKVNLFFTYMFLMFDIVVYFVIAFIMFS